MQRLASPDKELRVLDWFITFRKLPKEQLKLP